MTGPDHYREAERLLAEAREAVAPKRSAYPLEPGEPTSAERYERAMTEAQIHATLALAAATAIGASGTEGRAWTDAAGTKPRTSAPPPGPGVRPARRPPDAP